VDWKGRRLSALVGAVALAVIAGCTPSGTTTQTATPPATSASTTSTPTVTPSATETPIPTWGAEQAAAIQAVDDFDATSTAIAADPGSFTEGQMTELFEKSVGGDVLTRNVESFLTMGEKGYREVGSREAVFTLATEPVDDGRGAEVHVTRCWNQQDLTVVDSDGVPVGEKDGDEGYLYPDYNLRQYTVLKPPDESAFRVFGVQTINGACP
jgi:hypothetical protein